MELLEPRSSRDCVFVTPAPPNPSGGEEKELDSGRVVVMARVGCKIAAGPFGRVGMLRDGTRDMGSPVGISGPMVPMVLIDVMEVVIGIGAKMGMVGMMDRFGMDPIPKRAEEDAMGDGAGTGGCFMMRGRELGRLWPCSFIFISFMAMENSSWSIFPSLFMSARAHISASTVEGRPDCRKNFRAWSPDT